MRVSDSIWVHSSLSAFFFQALARFWGFRALGLCRGLSGPSRGLLGFMIEFWACGPGMLGFTWV